MKTTDAAWLTLIAAGLALEVRAIKRGQGTLTECTRRVFRTDTDLGAEAFSVVLSLVSGRVNKHIREGGW